jgi:hypothetical protein
VSPSTLVQFSVAMQRAPEDNWSLHNWPAKQTGASVSDKGPQAPRLEFGADASRIARGDALWHRTPSLVSLVFVSQ